MKSPRQPLVSINSPSRTRNRSHLAETGCSWRSGATMAIRVALNHKTSYQYDKLVTLFPQVIRLRPAPHCRPPVTSYSLKVNPQPHFVNWQQDPHSNYLARYVFPDKVSSLEIEVDLVA